MKTFKIDSLKHTKELADKTANGLRGGEVIGLVGELGAGKTTFVQFLAQALGIKEKVNSPTFVLMKVYQLKGLGGLKNFVHVDAYRLSGGKALKNIGLEEYLGRQDSAVMIEWADRVKDILPLGSKIITIKEAGAGRIFEIS